MRTLKTIRWTPLWLNFAETGFNPQAADVLCFYFPGVNSSHSFFILLDILHHDRFSRSLDSWRKLIFNALSEAFMADHRTYTICSGFRTGSLPACWRMYHSRQSGCFMVARYGQVSWSRFGGLNMSEYVYIYIICIFIVCWGLYLVPWAWWQSGPGVSRTIVSLFTFEHTNKYQCIIHSCSSSIGDIPILSRDDSQCLGDGWPNGCISSKWSWYWRLKPLEAS